MGALPRPSPDAPFPVSSREEQLREIPAILASIWQKSLPLMRDRLAILDAVAVAAIDGDLSQALREEGTNTAHKLAGSLGTFGFPQGTAIARTLEHLLLDPATPDGAVLQGLAEELHNVLQL